MPDINSRASGLSSCFCVGIFSTVPLPPPGELGRFETRLLDRLFHVPGGVFPRLVGPHLELLCKTPFRLPTALCWASFARASARTFQESFLAANDFIAWADVSVPWHRFRAGLVLSDSGTLNASSPELCEALLVLSLFLPLIFFH